MKLSLRIAAVVAVFALSLIALGGSAAATRPGVSRPNVSLPLPLPVLVVQIRGFIGPYCSAPVFRVTNIGGLEQPFGWSLRLVVPRVGIDQTFTGQQPVAPGETGESVVGTGLSAPGTYLVILKATDVSGISIPGLAILRLPASC